MDGKICNYFSFKRPEQALFSLQLHSIPTLQPNQNSE